MRLHKQLRTRASAFAIATVIGAATIANPALAGGLVLPSGGQVVAGSANISASATGVTVDQTTATAVIDWQGFSVGAGGFAQFNNGQGATLNRVTGGEMSTIAGQLSATGSLYLINPAGVVVDGSGKVLTGGSFIASTRAVDMATFMAGGELSFVGDSAGGIVNRGSIATGADAVLIGRYVENSGSIDAKGDALLAAGTRVVLREASADSRIYVDGGSGDLTNSGDISGAAAELRSAGGNVYALAGNNGGLIRATADSLRGGKVVIASANDTVVEGRVKAVGQDGDGGTVYVLGKNIGLRPGSEIDASGSRNGGKVLVGGDYLGGKSAERRFSDLALPTAATLTMAKDSHIDASGGKGASGTGAGGNVVLWSDVRTDFDGAIRVRAGDLGGDGGFVETSSKGLLNFRGDVDAASPLGKAGTLLLDPTNITIQANNPDVNGDATTGDDIPGSGTIASGDYGAVTSIITAGAINALLNAGTSVDLRATNNINVNSSIAKTSGNSQTVTFKLVAGNNISIANSVSVGLNTATNSTLNVDYTATAGTITHGTAASVTSSGTGNSINVTYRAGTGITTSTSSFATTGGNVDFEVTGTGAITTGGAITTQLGSQRFVTANGNVTINAALNSTRAASTAIAIMAGGSGNTLTTGASGSMSNAASGGISLTADQMVIGANVSVNTNGSGSSIRIAPTTAGRTITVGANDDTGKLQFDATEYARFVGGSASNNASVLEFNTGAGGTFESKTAAVTTSANIGEVNIIADRVSLATNIGATRFNIAPATSGRTIIIGGTDDASGNLELSQTEIQTNLNGTGRIRFGAVGTPASGSGAVTGIGTTTAGAIRITTSITKAAPLSLLSTGQITDFLPGGASPVGSLAVASLRATSGSTSGVGISLTNTANTISAATNSVSLATSGADIAYTDNTGASALQIGTVDGQNGLNAGSGTILLRNVAGTANIVQASGTAGAITAGALIAETVGTANVGFMLLNNTSNMVGTFAGYSNATTAAGNAMISYTNAGNLVVGSVTANVGTTGENTYSRNGLSTVVNGSNSNRIDLLVTGTSAVTQTQDISTGNLLMAGNNTSGIAANGATYTFTRATNTIGRIATNSSTTGGVKDVSVTTSGDVSINIIGTGNNGIDVLDTATVIAGAGGNGSITQGTTNDAIKAVNFFGTAQGTGSINLYTAQGTGGVGGNAVTNLQLTASNQNISYYENGGFNLTGTGINAGSGNVQLNNSGGTVTQSANANITGTGLALLGTSGIYTLNNSGNSVTTLAANTGRVSYVDTNSLSTGAVTGTVTTNGISVNATSSSLTDYTLALRTGAGTADSILTVNTGAAGNITTNSNGNAQFQTDRIALEGTVTATGRVVEIFASDGRAIDFGVTSAVAESSGGGKLVLSASETDNVTANTLRVGHLQAGNMVVGGSASFPNITTLALATAGTVDQTAGALSVQAGAGNLVIRGAGNIDLGTQNNLVANIALSSSGGSIRFRDDNGFALANLDGLTTSVVSPGGYLSLITGNGGSVTQSHSLTADNLRLTATGTGSFTLNNASNEFNTVAASTATSLTLNDTTGFTVGTVDGVAGVNVGTSTFTINNGGTTNQTAVITAGTLSLTGSGAVYELGTQANQVDNFNANTGSFDFHNAKALIVGAATATSTTAGTTAKISAVGGNLTLANTISTTGGNSGDDRVVLFTNRDIIANSGSDITTGNGRFLAYTNNPNRSVTGTGTAGRDDTAGDWAGTAINASASSTIRNAGHVYNNATDLTTSTRNGVAVTPTGNRFVYADQPTLLYTIESTTNKVYDGAATTPAVNYTNGLINAGGTGVGSISNSVTDTLTPNNVTGTAATSQTPTNAGTYTNITASQGTLASALGYAFAFTGTNTTTITPKALTITGATAQNKIYDATTAATVTGASISAGVVGGDDVVLGTLTASFDTKDVGTGKAVTVTGAALTGAQAGNYTVGNPVGLTANVTVRDVTIRAVTDTKTYDGTTSSSGTPTVDAATMTTGLVGGETLTGTQIFSSKDASAVNGRTLSVNSTTGGNGFLSGNYNVITVTALGTINKKAISATGITANDKVYDNTTDATFSGTATVSTGVAGETFDVSAGTVAFGDVNVGTAKTVTATGFALTNPGGGADANNYTFAQPSPLSANITARPITITAATSTKTYDGTTTSANTPTITAGTLAAGDTLNTLTQTFNTKDASVTAGDKTLTVAAPSFSAGLSSNYTITLQTATGTINKAALSVTGLTANNKIYDALTTATLSGTAALGGTVFGSDVVTLSGTGSGTFDTKDVGTGKSVTVTGFSLTGADAANYNLTQPGPLTANVTVRDVTIRAVTDTKTYDGTTSSSGTPTVDAATMTTGLVGGETLTGTQIFSSKDASAVNGRTLSVNSTTGGNGFLSGNYNVITVTALGTINKKAISATGITANDKVYDNTTDATFSGTATVSTGVAGETFDVSAGTVAFGDVNVGTAKTVTATGFALTNPGGGADANNYTFAQPSPLSANITARPITITAATSTKTYDGTTTSANTPTITAGTLAAGDTLNTLTQTFNTKDASVTAGDKTLTVAAPSFSAGLSSNYTITLQTATGTINRKALTVTGLSSQDKFYDGTNTATLTGTAVVTTGVAGETFDVTGGSATFSQVNAANNLAVTATGYALTNGQGGALLSNYTLSQPTVANANINKRNVTVDAVTQTKTYDGTTASTGTPTVSAFNAGTGAGFITGEGFSALSQAYQSANVLGANGSTLVPSFTLNGSTTAGNYNITSNNVAGTITPATLTVTAADKSKTFDNNAGTDPALTFSVTGLVNGETVSTALTGGFSGGGVGNGVQVTSSSALAREAGQNVGGGTGAGGAYRITNTGASPLTAANNNYTVTFNQGLFTINPAGISLTYVVGDSTYVYGDTPVFGSAAFNANGKATLTGVLGMDDVQVLVGNLSVFQNDGTTLIGTANSITGTTLNASGTAYKVKPVSLTLGGSNANNYILTDVGSTAGNLTVTPRTLTATLINSTSKVYDGNTAATLTSSNYALSGFVGGQGATVTETAGTYDTANAGTGKTVTATLASNDFTANGGTLLSNYTLPTTASGAIGEITRKAITITGVGANDKFYDGTTAATANGTATVNGLVGGQTLGVTAGTLAFASANVNGNNLAQGVTATGYAVTDGTGLASNYILNAQPTIADAIINKRNVTLTAANDTKTYDGTTAQSAGITLSSLGVTAFDSNAGGNGFVAGQGVQSYTQVFNSKDVSTANQTNLTGTGAGFTLNGSTIANNYNITTATGTGTITAKAISVTGITANNKVYDATTGATFTGTPTVSTGVAGETFDVSNGTVAFGQSNVGTGLTVTASGFGLTNAGGGATASNYSLAQPSGLTANITARPLRINAVTDTKTYDGTVTSAGVPTVGTGVANEGLAGLDALNALLQKFDSPNASAANGRTLNADPATFSAGSASNYNIIYTSATGTINQRVVTISGLTAQDKIYDGNTNATVTGGTLNNTISGDTLTFTQGTNSFASKNVGNNQTVTLAGYTLGGSSAGNYVLNVQPGPLTASITPKSLTASLINSTTKVYDGNTAATLTGTNYQLAGFVSGEGASVTETVGVYNNKNVATGKGVTATLDSGDFTANMGTLLSNYTLPTTATGNIGIITPKAVTLTGLTAENKVYDANTSATLTGGTITGAIAGDTVSVSSGTGTFDNANVGTAKSVTVSGITFGGTDAGNYTFTPPTGLTANITPAALTVAGPSVSKVYGAADPTLTPTVTGLKGTDTASAVLTGALTRATGSNVGNYSVTQGTLASNPNYTVTYTPGLFAITPAQLTLTAAAQTKVYGTTDPSLTFGATGFVNGDTASILTGALSRAAGENVGSYAIAQGGVSAGSNYTIVYNGANLSITPATLTVLPNPTTKVYGDSDPTLGFTLTGLTNGDTSSVVTGLLGRNPGENAGGYAFVPGTLTGGGNYVIALSPNAPLFQITPAVLQVAANPANKTFGTADPALTFTLNGLKNGDTASVVTGTQTRAPGENAGIYGIQQGTVAAGPNYTIVYTPNNLTIGRAALNISIPNATRLAGQPNPAFPATVSGLTGGDTLASLFGSTGVPVTTTATTDSPAGQFPLTASVNLANYTVTVVPGTLTVTAAAPPVMVTPEPVAVPGLGSSIAALAGGIGSASGSSNFGVVGSSSFAPPSSSGLAITIRESASTSDPTTVNQATVQVAGNSADVGGTRASGADTGTSTGYIDQEVGGGRFTVVVDTTKVDEQAAFDTATQGTVQVEEDTLAADSMLRDSSFDMPLPADETEEERLARVLRERQAQGTNGGNAASSASNAVALRR
jgi:filamentous hemagglutinin family protein